MAIVKMKKMHLLGLKTEQSSLLRALQKTGVVEVIDILEAEEPDSEVQEESQIHSELAKELSDLETKLADLKFGIDFLKPHTEEENPLVFGKPKIKKEELNDVLEREDQVYHVLKAVFDLDKRLSQLKVEEGKLHNQMEMLVPWKSLDIPVEELGPTKKTVFVPIIMSRKSKIQLESKLREDELLAEMKTLGESQDDIYALIIYHQDNSDEIQNLFKEFSINIQEFPGLIGAPGEIIRQDEARLVEIEKERENIKAEAKALGDQKLAFEILYDYYSLERDRKEAFLKVSDTDKTFSLEAWVPAEKEEQVMKKIGEITDSVYVELSEPTDEDEMPVLLSNSKLIEPFEVITELYSLPDPRGIDPNVFMAPFYFVFFGMMLSDAGYGIIVSLLAGLAMKRFKLVGQAKKFTEMLFLCGISTFFWGAIFGGWFGDLIRLKPLWINPLDNPIAVLILAFILGIIQIYVGILLNAYKNIRAGKVADALMDQGLWLVLLTGLLMFALPGYGEVAKYLSIIGAVGLILTQGRTQKGPIKKLTSGILSLYDVTGYLSDILSYSRLLALGLTTGVIATVINTMAKTVAGNVIGYIVMILILLGGHVFNIAINVLGAYVHSSRLQYIEFFGKFYDSGGRAFEPLSLNTTYVELEDM